MYAIAPAHECGNHLIIRCVIEKLPIVSTGQWLRTVRGTWSGRRRL
jgi:hypothetical protein